MVVAIVRVRVSSRPRRISSTAVRNVRNVRNGCKKVRKWRRWIPSALLSHTTNKSDRNVEIYYAHAPHDADHDARNNHIAFKSVLPSPRRKHASTVPHCSVVAAKHQLLCQTSITWQCAQSAPNSLLRIQKAERITIGAHWVTRHSVERLRHVIYAITHTKVVHDEHRKRTIIVTTELFPKLFIGLCLLHQRQ